MNKKTITLLLCSLIFSHVWSLSLSNFGGFENGYIGEYVFAIQGDNSLYELSRLTWDIDSVYTMGASVGFQTPKKGWGLFQFDAELQVFFPQKSGFLQDYDFLNGDGILTHYSKHKNQIDGVSISCMSIYRALDWLGLSFGVKTGILSFIGSNGYSQYPSESSAPYTPWHDNITPYFFSGKVITYQITSFNFYLGINLHFLVGNRVSISAQSLISPYSYFLCVDNHILTSVVYIDSVSSIFSTYENKIYGGFIITPNTEIGITLQHLKTINSKGSSYQKKGLTTYQISNALGGFSQDRFSVIFSLTQKL